MEKLQYALVRGKPRKKHIQIHRNLWKSFNPQSKEGQALKRHSNPLKPKEKLQYALLKGASLEKKLSDPSNPMEKLQYAI